MPDPVASQQSGGPPEGPYAYLPAAPPDALFVADAGGGSERPIAVPLQSNDRIDSLAVGGGWITLVAWHTTGPTGEGGVPCSSSDGQPVAWRIMAAQLGTDGQLSTAWRTVDQGTATRRWGPPDVGEFCFDVVAPSMAMAAGRIAHAVENGTAAQPDATRIVVRSLSSGSTLRTYRTLQHVVQVVLSPTDIAWTQSVNDWSATTEKVIGQPYVPGDWRIFTAALSQTTAHAVSSGAAPDQNWPSGLTMAGSSVVISNHWMNSAPVYEATAAGRSVIDPGPAARVCTAAAADAGWVVLGCQGPSGAPDWTSIWTARAGLRAISVLGTTNTDPGSLQDGWLFLDGYVNQRSMLVAVPAAALR
jgi:hypothetical protein